MAFNYDEYLRVDKMPTQWCWGCGDGVVLKCIIRAIEKLGWNMDDVCLVSGIGCSGRMSSYVNCNTVHTTHGRAIAYATGIKLANPSKTCYCGKWRWGYFSNWWKSYYTWLSQKY